MKPIKIFQILHALAMGVLAIYMQATTEDFKTALAYHVLAVFTAFYYAQKWTNDRLKKRNKMLEGYLAAQLKEKNK